MIPMIPMRPMRPMIPTIIFSCCFGRRCTFCVIQKTQMTMLHVSLPVHETLHAFEASSGSCFFQTNILYMYIIYIYIYRFSFGYCRLIVNLDHLDLLALCQAYAASLYPLLESLESLQKALRLLLNPENVGSGTASWLICHAKPATFTRSYFWIDFFQSCEVLVNLRPVLDSAGLSCVSLRRQIPFPWLHSMSIRRETMRNNVNICVCKSLYFERIQKSTFTQVRTCTACYVMQIHIMLWFAMS